MHVQPEKRRAAASQYSTTRTPTFAANTPRPRSARSTVPWRTLVVQCQADLLRAQRLALGEVIAGSQVLLGEAVHMDVNAAGDLDAGIRRLGRRKFGAVALVAHANADGVQLAPDEFVDWEDLARLLKRTRVEKLLLIACSAGGQSAAESLFRGVPTLRRIYGCPDLLPFSQALPVSAVASFLLGEADLPEEIRLLLQGVHLVRSNGLFFEHRREELSTAAGRGRALLHQLGAVALKALNRS